MPDLPGVGEEFAGYRLGPKLGWGGMSVVFQAENWRLGKVVALKILAPALANDDTFRTRFLQESRIAASLNHPHVVPISDYGASDGLLYIAMRYVAGTDLRQMIANQGCLPPAPPCPPSARPHSRLARRTGPGWGKGTSSPRTSSSNGPATTRNPAT